jgi:hypothetical protein
VNLYGSFELDIEKPLTLDTLVEVVLDAINEMPA